MQKLTLAFFPIARTTFDLDLANRLADAARTSLEQAGVSLLGPEDLITDLAKAQNAVELLQTANPDLVVFFQATFADSTMLMSLVEMVDAPILLWAVPESHSGDRLRLNSFCGINLGGHALTRSGYRYNHLFSTPDDPQAIQKILVLAKAGRARNLLKRSRLGRVGENPAGFETCLLDKEKIKDLFGLEVVQFDLEEDVFTTAQKIAPVQIDLIQNELEEKVSGLHELDPAPTRKSLSVFAALQQVSQQQNIQGFAVRCWPEFFTEMGCAACGAMSMMSDSMVPCSCEADVNGTITQMILQSISGEPAFGTDMVSVDQERGALVIWHCGLAPLSMADPEGEKGVTIHSNRKLPLLFEFTLKPGRVTVARLSEASGEYKLVIGAAEMIRGPKSFSGTSGLLTFDRPANEIIDFIMDNGLEHHVSITYGDHTDALRAFANMLDIPILEI